MQANPSKRFKLIPDEVFQHSALLQKLAAAGLYDQNAASNFAPPFQVFSRQAFAAQGSWGTAFFESDLFKRQVAAENEIELPREILEAMVMEPHGHTQSLYRDYTVSILRHIGDRATSDTNAQRGTAFPVPVHDNFRSDAPTAEWMMEFVVRVCAYVLTMIQKLVPDLRSGALPLSSRAPGFKPPSR